MARYTSVYKQTGPTRRVVSGENTFEKGMHYTNQPIRAGYVKTLLNFEIDSVSGVLSIPGGFSTNKIAYADAYADKLYIEGAPENIFISQPRNRKALEPFMVGITNILSVQKLNLEDILNTTDYNTQYLTHQNNVSAYNILIYNPFNHNLANITLILSPNSSAILTDKLELHKIQVNPISQGFGELWRNADGILYPSNNNYFRPVEDEYIPKPIRIKYDTTFKHKLYHNYAMRTVAHTRAYGKGFMFMDKTFNLSGQKPKYEQPNTTPGADLEDIAVFECRSIYWASSTGYVVGDIVYVIVDETVTLYNPARYPEGDLVKPLIFQVSEVDGTGAILDYKTLNTGVIVNTSGVFVEDTDDYTPALFAVRDCINLTQHDRGTVTDAYVTRYVPETIPNPEEHSGFIRARWNVKDLEELALYNLNPAKYVDFFRNQKYIGNHTLSGIFNARYLNPDYLKLYSPDVPIDSIYGRLGRTSLALRSKTQGVSNTIQLKDEYLIYNSWEEGSPLNTLLNQEGNLIALDLDSGNIRALQDDTVVDIFALPGEVDDPTPTYPSGPVLKRPNTTSIYHIFEQHRFEGKDNIFLPDHLAEDVIKTLKPGQSIRVVAYCEVVKPLSQNKVLPILSANVDVGNYYRLKTPGYKSLFTLEYTWTGLKWVFNFLDNNASNYNVSVPTWYPQRIDAQGGIYLTGPAGLRTPVLGYTDVITSKNKDEATKSSYTETKEEFIVINRDTQEFITHSTGVVNNLDTTIGDIINTGDTENNVKKVNSLQYGFFEVKPKSLTPAMASRWGYNMLSPTPYTFECQNTPMLDPTLTGVILMRGTQPLLNPVVNTPAELYIYYNADITAMSEGDPYLQLNVEYKNVYDDWRYLAEFNKEDTHAMLSEGKPIVVPFTSPDEQVLIRVNLIDTNTTVEVANREEGTVEEHYLTASALTTALSFVKSGVKTGVEPKVFNLSTALGMTYWKGRLVLWGVEDASEILFMSEPNEPEYFAYPNGIDIFEEDIKHVIPYSDSLVVFTATKLWKLDMLTDGLSWTKTLIQQNLMIDDKDIPYIVLQKNMLFFKSGEQFFMLVPQRSGTVGETTIAPVSKSISTLLAAPFKVVADLLKIAYTDVDETLFNYIVQYGAHAEQDKIFVDWYIDLRAWSLKAPPLKERDGLPDHLLANGEYLLIQLVYDTQKYAWSFQTHTTNSIGVFLTDAANKDTDYINLIYTERAHYFDPNNTDNQYEGVSLTTYRPGVAISNRENTPDAFVRAAGPKTNLIELDATLKRIQILDTGFKETSTPALKKRFREVQFSLEPKATDVGFRPIMEVSIDGREIVSLTKPAIIEEDQGDGVMVIKVIDQINYQDITMSQFITGSELNNAFTLDSTALKGVKHIQVRKGVNGKGNLIGFKFVNTTETNYNLISYAFVLHNKNSR